MKQDYKEFCEHVKEEIKGFLPEEYASYEIALNTVSKPNIGMQVGLTFVPPASGIPAPVIYLEPYYDAYLNRGMSVGHLMTQIADLAVKEDGEFGPKTKAATLAFQRAKGLEIDGIAGPESWGAGLRILE